MVAVDISTELPDKTDLIQTTYANCSPVIILAPPKTLLLRYMVVNTKAPLIITLTIHRKLKYIEGRLV